VTKQLHQTYPFYNTLPETLINQRPHGFHKTIETYACRYPNSRLESFQKATGHTNTNRTSETWNCGSNEIHPRNRTCAPRPACIITKETENLPELTAKHSHQR
jgi:hypothetical protein